MNLVLIPGLLCTQEVWGQINTLRNEYKCVDADVISFNSINAMSNAVIENLPIGNIAIIGISMGGYVAIDTAIKLGSKIKKLILINTTSNPVDASTIQEREKAIKMANNGMLKTVMTMSEGMCYFKPKAEWLSLERKMALDIGASVYIKQQRAIIDRENHSRSIRNITADTLIIAGREDKITPLKDSIHMSKQIKRSCLVILEECGHLSTLEKGSEVLDAIKNFLEV